MRIIGQKQKNDDWIYWVVFTAPVIWLGLLLAPCMGGNLLDITSKLMEALRYPFSITWQENSLNAC